MFSTTVYCSTEDAGSGCNYNSLVINYNYCNWVSLIIIVDHATCPGQNFCDTNADARSVSDS